MKLITIILMLLSINSYAFDLKEVSNQSHEVVAPIASEENKQSPLSELILKENCKKNEPEQEKECEKLKP